MSQPAIVEHFAFSRYNENLAGYRFLLREQRIRRMNLQLLRHGIGRPILRWIAGLAFALSMGIAQAQGATHTQLTVASGDHGITYTAHVNDIAGKPATDGVISLESAHGSLGSAFVNNG